MKIVFVTCSGFSQLTSSDQDLLKKLKSLDYLVEIETWNDRNVNWNEYSVVILRSCWDYHLFPSEFIEWLNILDSFGIKTWNPIETIKWNINKKYLQKLMKKGVNVIPSFWMDSKNKYEFFNAIEKLNSNEIVIKPSIGASAFGAYIEDKSKILDESIKLNSNFFIQEFIPEIHTNGEWSLIFFNGIFSHSVLKKPREGDFRVQSKFGGNYVYKKASNDIIKECKSILTLANQEFLYARVDGIETDKGFLLMELEMIEPSLFLGNDSKFIKSFSSAIIEKLKIN